MKVELTTYMHSETGITLSIVAETEHERKLLDGIWKHGTMVRTYPDRHSIDWKMEGAANLEAREVK